MPTSETRIALIHRVIIPDTDYPKEYAVLVTDHRSIFVRQPKTRNNFVLRGEMRYGTALVTDIVPKTLEDFEETDLDTLAIDPSNLNIAHDNVTSLVLTRGEPKFRWRDLFVWLTMRRQGHKFRVYDMEMSYRKGDAEARIRFYLIPLGAWFKPRRMTQSREAILHDYAMDALRVFNSVLPPGTVKEA